MKRRALFLLALLFVVATTFAGVEPLRFYRLSMHNNEIDSRIAAIAEDSVGNIWISTRSSLCRFDGHCVHTYVHTDSINSIPDNKPGFIFTDKDGTVWVRNADKELYSRYRPATDDFETFSKDALPDKRIAMELKERSYNSYGDAATIWTTPKHVLTQTDRRTKETIEYSGENAQKCGLKDDKVFGIILARNGTLWVATASKGVYFAYTRKDRLKVYPTADNISPRAICDDGGDGLFIGQHGDGLMYLNPTRSATETVHYPLDDTKSGREVRHLLRDRTGALWVGTRAGLCYRENDDAPFRSFTVKTTPALPNDSIYAILEDTVRKAVWIGTWRGLVCLDRKTLKPLAKADRSAEMIRCFALGKDGTLWVAAETGVYRKTSPSAPAECVVPNALCYSIDIDPDGNIWFGTVHELLLLKAGEVKPVSVFPHSDNENHSVSNVVCDGNYVWATEGKTLVRINRHTIRPEVMVCDENLFCEDAVFRNPRTHELIFGSFTALYAYGATVEEPSQEIPPLSTFLLMCVCAGLIVCAVFFYVRRRRNDNDNDDDNDDDNDNVNENDGSAGSPTDDEEGDAPSYSELLDREFMEKAAAVAEKHMMDTDFDANTFASEMATSRAQLFRKMKAASGMTPMEYLNNMRVQKAAKLLRTTTDSINEIAYTCGYSDASSFRRNFQKIMGSTPSKYRNP